MPPTKTYNFNVAFETICDVNLNISEYDEKGLRSKTTTQTCFNNLCSYFVLNLKKQDENDQPLQF